MYRLTVNILYRPTHSATDGIADMQGLAAGGSEDQGRENTIHALHRGYVAGIWKAPAMSLFIGPRTAQPFQVVVGMYALALVVVHVDSIAVAKHDELVVVEERGVNHRPDIRTIPPRGGRIPGC